MTRLTHILLVMALAFGAIGCSEGLSGTSTRALFSGSTVEGEHDKHGYTFISYYEPSGRFRSYQDGSDTPLGGDWWVDSAGLMCIRWDTPERDKQKGELCRRIVANDDGTYEKVLETGDGTKTLVTYYRFTRGNPHNL